MLYFDHNATTPMRPEVRDLVRQAEEEAFGNPSSQHAAGRKARALLEEGRERLAKLLGVRATEMVFTSGGTEANRLAVEGAFEGFVSPGAPHAIVSGIEHPSVLEVVAGFAAGFASRRRVELTLVPASLDGRVPVPAILSALRPSTRLVSLQHANSETGVIQPVEELARLLQERYGGGASASRPLLLVDAVQSLGKIPVRPADLGADLVSMSSHKIGGPKGAGAFWVRPGRGFVPPAAGGPQERKMRPGTENVPGILGFVRGAELALASLQGGSGGGLEQGECLRKLLLERVEDAVPNGGPAHVLSNTVNVSFHGVSAELLVIRLDQEGVAVSMGSACASGSREPSAVLRAMGLSPERVSSAVRFSTGWTTRRDEVERVAEIVRGAVDDLRGRAAGAVRSGPAKAD